jgi:hypothetical protein
MTYMAKSRSQKSDLKLVNKLEHYNKIANKKKLAYASLAISVLFAGLGLGLWKKISVANEASAMTPIAVDEYKVYVCRSDSSTTAVLKASLFNGSNNDSGLQISGIDGKSLLSVGPVEKKKGSRFYSGYDETTNLSTVKFTLGQWNSNDNVSTSRALSQIATCP